MSSNMNDVCPYDAPEIADSILETVDDLCEEFDLTFFLFAGVCLGFYREGDYIERDNDIDIAIIANKTEYLSLIKRLLQLDFQESVFEPYKLLHLRRNNMLLDLRRVGKAFPYVVPSPRQYTFRKFDIITHCGRDYNVPGPIEKYLEHNYGEWKVQKFRDE